MIIITQNQFLITYVNFTTLITCSNDINYWRNVQTLKFRQVINIHCCQSSSFSYCFPVFEICLNGQCIEFQITELMPETDPFDNIMLLQMPFSLVKPLIYDTFSHTALHQNFLFHSRNIKGIFLIQWESKQRS